MYQVVWTRSLSLIFGGSHLAVTVVLSIFMAGLALGSYLIGKYADNARRPLFLYGVLEVGIALFAVVFIWLSGLYPSLYVALASGREDSQLYLTAIRVAFSAAALIVPTTLMGGTLPVLSRSLSGRPEKIRAHLSFLYGFNTLGAVVGAAAAGFYFLRFYSVSLTLNAAIAMNLAIGLASMLVDLRRPAEAAPRDEAPQPSAPRGKTSSGGGAPSGLLPLRLVLVGIGVSGFCALGYEVLWTRTLSIVVGGSVYSFTTMLVAFLTGIALGSKAYGLVPRLFRLRERGVSRSVLWFGAVQVAIGVTALLVTIYIRDLPDNSARLARHFTREGLAAFDLRLWTNFALAYLYMFVPAFFMGVAFPLAGKIRVHFKGAVGLGVGEVMSYNTVGAILGASVSGFLLINLFGLERSLQLLSVLNVGFGLLVMLSLLGRASLNLAAAGATAAAMALLVASPGSLRAWNTKHFAIFQNNKPDALATPELVLEALENTDVLYYEEGAEATISAVKLKGGRQSLLVNGKVVASTNMEDQQCQLTLGHLPMLLHEDPRKVLVVGLGTGMTLGAASVHPSVEEITLVEIAPKVVGGARTFGDYNHHVLDDPRLRVVFNDGRNFLLTTPEKFDVITADPIHPWAQGASYLYTVEYFRLASAHLRPGGIICQWLPMYELSLKDLKSVVRTFSENFRYTMLWLTQHDAELIGSNSPIVIDEEELGRRVSADEVAEDLRKVHMGSAEDFLSYFVAGAEGLRAFSRDGILNTDDNLYLEFSSPTSIARPVVTENLSYLARYQESVLPYLRKPEDPELRAGQESRWRRNLAAARASVRARALFMGGLEETQEFSYLMAALERQYPSFAPGRYLREALQRELAMNPRLIERHAFEFLTPGGRERVVDIHAVLKPISRKRAYIVFLDYNTRKTYAKLLVTNPEGGYVKDFVGDLMDRLRSIYRREAREARREGEPLPDVSAFQRIKSAIRDEVREEAGASG